jgi:hypothetical protein
MYKLDFFQCAIESWNEHECSLLANENEPSFLQEHKACVIVTKLEEGMGAITIQHCQKGCWIAKQIVKSENIYLYFAI